MTTDPDARIRAAIDRDRLLRCLADLVACRSVGGAEQDVQWRAAEWMRTCGMDVDQWDIDFDVLARHSAYTVEIERTEGIGVVGAFGSGTGKTLIVDAHVDVVPAGDPDRWSVPPWEATVRDGRVYGRGALDVKGGLCCALFAVKALQDAGVTIPGRVLVQSVIGEEDGGCGTLAAIARGYRGDAAIAIEPTMMTVATAQAGALNFRITVEGRAAHGCVRDEGESAIEHFYPIFDALNRFERERNSAVDDERWSGYRIPFAINVGRIHAGDWGSTVPETLVAEGRFGIAPGEALEEARHAFEACVSECAKRDAWLAGHPPCVEWVGAQFASATVPNDHEVVSTMWGALETVKNERPAITGMPFGSNARLLIHEAQTPAVVFGPGDIRRAHAPDEWVAIDDLIDATHVLALTILRFCR